MTPTYVVRRLGGALRIQNTATGNWLGPTYLNPASAKRQAANLNADPEWRPYNPIPGGLVERMNRTLSGSLEA